MSSTKPRPSPIITAAEWDRLRSDFHHSLLVDTSLAALADNIDGCRWPISNPDETPAAYIDLPHAEAVARLEAARLSPTQLDNLAKILRGTLAFDDSFSEMVDVAGRAEADADPVQRNLERLGIPPDFPVTLCNLTPGTLDFCRRESITVLADFLAFSRGASRSVVIGGEFRDLLNALVHIDERVIARYLPYRTKTSGLYLIEGLAHLARPLSAEARARLARDAATELPPEQRAIADQLVDHFSAQLTEIRAALASGTPLPRLVAALDEFELEPAVAAILRLYLPTVRVSAPAPAKKSFLRRLFRLGA